MQMKAIGLLGDIPLFDTTTIHARAAVEYALRNTE